MYACIHLKNKARSHTLMYVKVLLEQIQIPACTQVFESCRHNQACMTHQNCPPHPHVLFASIYVSENFLYVSRASCTLAVLL